MIRKSIKSGLEYYDNKVESERIIILIGGLGDTPDGFYSKEVMKFGKENGIKVISLGLRSMPYYYLYRIEEDLEDLTAFYKELKISAYKNAWFIGHSTGCQILMLFSQEKEKRDSEVFILQAPVSDREYEESKNSRLKLDVREAEYILSHFKKFIRRYRLCEDKVFMFYNYEYQNTKFLLYRFLSLFKKGGTEDFFSLDQDPSYLNKSETDIYSIVSTEDEYIVKPIEQIVNHLKKIRNMKKIYLLPGDHGFTQDISPFLGTLKEIISLSVKET